MGMSMEEQLAYVMIVLKHCELPQPKYKAIAEEAGINNSNNAYVYSCRLHVSQSKAPTNLVIALIQSRILQVLTSLQAEEVQSHRGRCRLQAR